MAAWRRAVTDLSGESLTLVWSEIAIDGEISVQPLSTFFFVGGSRQSPS